MTKSERVQTRIQSGQPFRIAEIAEEVGCTPPLVSQVKAKLQSGGADFEEQVLPGPGAPTRFRLMSQHEVADRNEAHKQRRAQRTLAAARQEVAALRINAWELATALDVLAKRLDATP